MSGQKRNIAMTPEEVHAFLATRRSLVVAAVPTSGGTPVASVATARYDDGELEFDLPADDPVARAIAADDRVCVIAEQAPAYFEIKAVIVRGSASRRPVDDDGRVRYRVAVGSPTSFDFGRIRQPADGSPP
ncbi:MAG: hypothetical protein ABW122_05335 [Ilumatobacteraceae bacterium]